MIGLSTTEVVIALAALVIVTLTLAKLFTRKPKRAEKWEKAEIMKQLLALSEQESGRRVPTPAARPRTQTASPVARPGQVRAKTTGKASVAVAGKGR